MPNWTKGMLRDTISSLDAGVSVNSEDRPHGAGEVGVLKTSALSQGVFKPEQNKAVLRSERKFVAEPVQADSILVSRMNTPALVGKACYVSEAYPTLFLPDRIWQLKPKDRRKTNMRWLSFVLQSVVFRKYVDLHAVGTSGSMKNIPKAKLLDFSVNYPPLGEQKGIAKILDTLDTQIQKTEAVIAKLQQVKQGLLHDLLTRGVDANGQLRPPREQAPELYKESSMGWIPREWDVVPLGDLLSHIEGGWSPNCPETRPAAGQWGVLKVSAVTSGVYKDHEAKSLPAALKPKPGLEVKVGDVILTRANGNPELVAKTVLVGSTQGKLMLSDKLLRLVPSNKLDASFLVLLMGFYKTRDQIGTLISGSSGQKNISQAQINGLLVPHVALEEQVRATAMLEAINARIASEILDLEKLKKHKLGLMDDLLTGRVRVNHLTS
jgi:type I restriction enzyme S subunit